MRVVPLLVVALAVAPALHAQSRLSPPSAIGSLPSIGLPLPRITPPLAPIGLPRRLEQPWPGAANAPRGHAPHGHRGPGKAVHPRPSIIYIVPAYPWGPLATYSATKRPGYLHAEVRERKAATGVLRLNVERSSLVQVYVDGFFVGTAADVDGRLELDEGEHRIELRAPGFQSVTFDVRIAAGQSITYSTPVEPLAPAPPDPPEAAGRPAASAAPPGDTATPAIPQKTTVYMIPGCYLGNVPPAQVRLAPGCDASKAISYEP